MSVSNAAPSAVSPTETTPAISRTNIILLVLLLVQVAITAYLFWPSTAAVVNDEPLLHDVNSDAVTALTITDDSDKSVSFVKEGDLWTLADSGGYPAKADKISETLTKLTAIKANRLVTKTPGSHGRLQVADDDYLRKVDITTAGGTQTLYLGSSSGAAATHVRAQGEDETYLTDAVATWELDTLPTTWIDVTYYTVPKEEIREVKLENANGTFTFVPNGPNGEEWALADATADEPIAPANISTLIDRITTLNLYSVLGKENAPEYGLDTPLATVTVTSAPVTTDTTTAKTTTTTLVVGAKDDETNTYVLKSSGSDFYVRLAAFTGDEFVNKTRSDLYMNTDASTDAGAPAIGPVAGPTPPVNEPAVDASGITTTTTSSDVDTVEAVTTTNELEDGTAAEPEVNSTGVQTTTSESDADGGETEEPAATATPAD